jgi:hypothetical protein
VIKGVLPETGFATIGGQSGSGKSAQAIHLGVHLLPEAAQEYYIDRYRIKRKGGVLYLVLEGKHAFHLRLETSFEATLGKQRMKFEAGKPVGKQMKFGDRFMVPFAWNTYRPNLFERGPDDLIRLAEREVPCGPDTGEPRNQPSHGAAQAARQRRLGPGYSLSVARHDEDGDPLTTCVVKWEPDRRAQKEEKRPSAQAMLEKVLAETLNQHGTRIKPNGKDVVRAVRKDTVMFAFKAAYQAERGDADADAVSRAWRRAP